HRPRDRRRARHRRRARTAAARQPMDRDRPVSDRPDQRRAAARSGFAFVVATAAAIGLAVVYGASGQTQAEGALLAVAFISIGAGLVTSAKHLLPSEPYA